MNSQFSSCFVWFFTWITFDSSYFMVCLDVTWKGIFSSCNMITFWTLIGSIWMNSFYMVLQLNFWMPTIITQPTIEHIIAMVISDMFLQVLISSWYIVTLITFEQKGVPQNDFFCLRPGIWIYGAVGWLEPTKKFQHYRPINGFGMAIWSFDLFYNVKTAEIGAKIFKINKMAKNHFSR